MIIQHNEEEILNNEIRLQMENEKLLFIVKYLKTKCIYNEHKIKQLEEHIKWLQNR